MTSVISSLSLKLYLNSLVYHRNIFGSSSKVFGNLRKSSDIFGNSGKCSGTFVWPSDQFWKIFGNLRKVVGNLRKITKNARVKVLGTRLTLARRYEFYVLGTRTIFHSFAALTREILFLPLEHKIHIFSPPCNILYLSLKKGQTHKNRRQFDFYNNKTPKWSIAVNK